MALHRYTIEPLSAFATPLRSDTLYGHLLWRAAERHGPDKPRELIDAFAGGQPPFKLSSAFPAGFLPLPALPPIPRARFRDRFASGGGNHLLEALQHYKAFRKSSFVHFDTLRSLAENLSQERLFAAWCKDRSAFYSGKDRLVTTDQAHNSIDRQNGKVLAEGGLHFTPATWYAPGEKLDLYVETETPSLFEELLDELARTGYGADRTTGKGQFRFVRDADFDPLAWPQQGNAQLLLSLTAAETMTHIAGSYNVTVKHGRAWSGFGERNPFKKPFLALTEGAVMTGLPDRGFLLRNIHSNPDLVQVLWPVTLSVQLEVDNAD